MRTNKCLIASVWSDLPPAQQIVFSERLYANVQNADGCGSSLKEATSRNMLCVRHALHHLQVNIGVIAMDSIEDLRLLRDVSVWSLGCAKGEYDGFIAWIAASSQTSELTSCRLFPLDAHQGAR